MVEDSSNCLCRVPNFMCQGTFCPTSQRVYVANTTIGGDFIKSDGTGSFSIYGDKFPVSLCSCLDVSVRS